MPRIHNRFLLFSRISNVFKGDLDEVVLHTNGKEQVHPPQRREGVGEV